MEVSIDFIDKSQSLMYELISFSFSLRLLTEWCFENDNSDMPEEFNVLTISLDKLCKSAEQTVADFRSVYDLPSLSSDECLNTAIE